MKFRSIFPLALLAMQSALHGQDTTELLRKGEDALASGVWEIASLHFEECLANRSLGPAEKSQVAIRLAETWVREGKPAQAVDLLAQSFVQQSPEVAFWRGQALLGLGRFSEATNALTPLMDDSSAPHRTEAMFTLSDLHLALNQPDAALAVLSNLEKSAVSGVAAKARLHQVEILLDLDHPEKARETMPAKEAIGTPDQSYAAFLEAHLLLREGHPADAATNFQALVAQPQGQSQRRYHSAAVGLADALRAMGSTDAAMDFLLSFIQKNPDSPLLGALFDRLIDGLPAKPSAKDPVLDYLKQWIPSSDIPAAGALALGDSCTAALWRSDEVADNELLARSLFARAIGLHRAGTPESVAEAKLLFTRLRVEFPNHELTQRSLFLAARWALDDGADERAFSLFEMIRQGAASPDMQGKAAFAEARSAYARGDRTKALQLFDEAARKLTENESKSALLNAGIIRLMDSPSTPIQADRPLDPALTADLELESALTREDPAKRRAAIEEFLTKHPDHPRVAEARLASAEAALTGPAPDLSFARAQLDTIAADAGKSAAPDAIRADLVKLRIADLSGDAEAAIATAKSFLENHADTPAAAEAALVLGRQLFQNHSYNDARLVLQKLAANKDTDPQKAQAAWLLAARSAALVPTSQSQQEALILFDKAIEAKGSVADLARLEKARLMIDMNRLAEAADFLRKWFEALKPADPMHLPAGLLLGEATYAQGSARPASLNEALAVFDKLLTHAESQPALFNRLQYWRGKTLEEMPDAKNPALKRTKEAFIAYYSVLETSTPPAEWTYFEQCGNRALDLLEKAERWSAAIACAKKIASFNGPGAENAASHARQLQLKHMIWED